MRFTVVVVLLLYIHTRFIARGIILFFSLTYYTTLCDKFFFIIIIIIILCTTRRTRRGRSHAALGYVTAWHHQLLLDVRPVEFVRVRSDAYVMRRLRRLQLMLLLQMVVSVAKRFRRHVVPTARGVVRRLRRRRRRQRRLLTVVDRRSSSPAQRTGRRRRRGRQRKLWHGLLRDGCVRGYPSGHSRVVWVVQKLYPTVAQFGRIRRICSTQQTQVIIITVITFDRIGRILLLLLVVVVTSEAQTHRIVQYITRR